MQWKSPGAILLISCYELGHQPLGVALPLGFLKRAGYQPQAMDIAVESFDTEKATQARFVGISVPMHMALRMGVRVIERVREINPNCHICCYGLYAALNSDYLLQHGADSCIGGEYEGPLVAQVDSLESDSDDEIAGVACSDSAAKPYLERLSFALPTRDALPTLDKYAKLEQNGDCRTAGYVEASRGCLHMCTHCPIPPVYEGRFFILPQEVVVEDIRRQVRAGATHITFGDPDFLNGPKHSLSVVRAMHEEFPSLTFDFTAKIEHLLHRGEHLPEFAEAGCLFIITAVESLSYTVLEILAKDHTRADVEAALSVCRDAGIPLLWRSTANKRLIGQVARRSLRQIVRRSSKAAFSSTSGWRLRGTPRRPSALSTFLIESLDGAGKCTSGRTITSRLTRFFIMNTTQQSGFPGTPKKGMVGM